MLTNERRSRGKASLAAVVLSLVYLALAARFLWRIVSNNLYADTRVFFGGWLGMTLLLYIISVGISFSERRRSGAFVPITCASLFGSLICLLFYGP